MPTLIQTGNAQIVKSIKDSLQANDSLDKSHKIIRVDSEFHIHSLSSLEVTSKLVEDHINEISLSELKEILPQKDNSLQSAISTYLEQHLHTSQLSMTPLIAQIPKKWSLYPPMVLFNTGTFDSKEWTAAFAESLDKNEFFKHVAGIFPGNITHLAINKPIIEEDAMRRPFNLVPLWGDFGPEPSPSLFSDPSPGDVQNAFWCSAVQNGIHQTWAPRYTMFSRGNIKEKKRVLDQFEQLDGKSVLDFYAGIGYFTLSYLANNASVFCWEINPWSIEGLLRGLKNNKHKFKLIPHNSIFTATDLEQALSSGFRAFVFHESNEKVPERLENMGLTEVSHINLGLLPSSKPSWKMARDASGGSEIKTTVHVHENVHRDKFTELRAEVQTAFGGHVTHLEKVKTFAPDVWHVVVDVEVGEDLSTEDKLET